VQISPSSCSDVPVDSPIEETFLAALLGAAARALVTVPSEDVRALAALARLGVSVSPLAETGGTDLARIRTYVFASEVPPLREATGEHHVLFGAGRGPRMRRDCATRAQGSAGRRSLRRDGRTDLRTPQQYLGLLEHALRRAGVPAHFDRGTRRPDPAGRAFLAIVGCAVERFSARRFAEYLSLGQVPSLEEERAARAAGFVAPDDEAFAVLATWPPAARRRTRVLSMANGQRPMTEDQRPVKLTPPSWPARCGRPGSGRRSSSRLR